MTLTSFTTSNTHRHLRCLTTHFNNNERINHESVQLFLWAISLRTIPQLFNYGDKGTIILYLTALTNMASIAMYGDEREITTPLPYSCNTRLFFSSLRYVRPSLLSVWQLALLPSSSSALANDSPTITVATCPVATNNMLSWNHKWSFPSCLLLISVNLCKSATRLWRAAIHPQPVRSEISILAAPLIAHSLHEAGKGILCLATRWWQKAAAASTAAAVEMAVIVSLALNLWLERRLWQQRQVTAAEVLGQRCSSNSSGRSVIQLAVM